MKAGYPERALKAYPAGSNGECGIPAELVPGWQRSQGGRVWDTEGHDQLDQSTA